MEDQDRLQRILDSMYEYVGLLSVEGTVLDTNQAFLNTSGLSRTDVLGRAFADTYWWSHSPDTQAQVRDAIHRAARGETVRADFRARVGDGLITIDAMFGPTRDQAGTIRELVASGVDVTEQRQLAEQLRQAMKMESMGRLAAGIAHDFNNLLTVIIGHTEMLLDTPRTGDDLESLTEVRDAANRATDMTRQLLAFSRQQMYHPVVLDINHVISDAEHMLHMLVTEDIAIETTLAPTLGHVRADPGQVTQALMNLVVNARDAMPAGGKISIRTFTVIRDEKYARLHEGAQPGRFVAIAVSDNGTGMSAEVKARVFEPFFTTKPMGKGTGLGMAVVHGIVRQSGGHIEVESEPGHGTTVTLCFPIVNDPLTAPPVAPTCNDAGGSETLLLVEDDDNVRRLAFRALREAGYHLLEARDGESALRLAKGYTDRIDLLITDVVLPGIDGPTCAEVLKLRHPELRVLYTSGYAGESLERRGIERESTAFLQKPYSPRVLRARIRQVLDGGELNEPHAPVPVLPLPERG